MYSHGAWSRVFPATIAFLTLFSLPFDSAAQRTPQKGITVVVSATITSLDPSVETHRSSGAIQNTIMETLAVYDADNRLLPLLAERWRSIDPNTWRISLKKGVKFHNGEEFTAESVKASVDVFNASKGFAGSWFQFIKEVKAVDSHTVDVVTKSPTPILPQTLGFLYAYPPKYFKEVGADTFGQKPIGTGPYKFVEWAKGEYIRVKADPSYRGGVPNIEEIVFRTAPEASTRVAMLETGRADIIMNVPPQMIERVERAGTRVETARSNRRVFVEFNRFDPILKDIRLRKALNYATDVDAIIKSIFAGRAYRAIDILRAGMPGYAQGNVQGYGYDPAKAKDLMRQAGYPNGFETELYVGVGRLTLDKELAEALVGQWEKVGIQAKLRPMEWAAFTTQAFTGKMPGMHILSHAPLWWDADFTWQNHFWSKATWKYAYTPEGDQMFEAQRAEMDVKKREALEQALEKYWVDEECAWIILYDQQDIYGVSKRLQWKARPDELMKFDEVTLAN